LQRLMLKSKANALESVRRVTQVNRGRSTPGIDHVVVTTPEERGILCAQLRTLDLHKVHPVRRVYIPKRTGQRPLGIPTIVDRCVQAMVKNALERFCRKFSFAVICGMISLHDQPCIMGERDDGNQF
jgi:RNA-directed DNA polymerase